MMSAIGWKGEQANAGVKLEDRSRRNRRFLPEGGQYAVSYCEVTIRHSCV